MRSVSGSNGFVRKPLLTPLDRAGKLVARWRSVWGAWVDHWSAYLPGKSQAEVQADTPGILTRLALAQNIADEITDAERDARRAAYLRALEFLEVGRFIRNKETCSMPRCPTVRQLADGIRDIMRKEGL